MSDFAWFMLMCMVVFASLFGSLAVKELADARFMEACARMSVANPGASVECAR